MSIRGNVEIRIRNVETGEERVVRAKNLIADTGLNLARNLFAGSGFRPDAIAVGTGTGSTAPSTTALENEVFRRDIDRRPLTDKAVGFEVFLSTSEANGFTLTEVGLFESSILVARAPIEPPISKTASIETTITHTLTFADGSS